MVKILSGDIQIVDIIVPLKTEKESGKLNNADRQKYEALETLIDQTLAGQRVKRGQKACLSSEQFQSFTKAASGLISKKFPGGSSANTLTTLRKLLPDKIEVNLLGVAGTADENSILIRDALKDAGINLIPKDYPPGRVPEPATSFVFQAADGSRTIFTYPGNAREILTTAMVTDALIAGNDVLFVQASLWEKFDESFPDKLLQSCCNKDTKEVWLALPTHAKFRDNMSPARYQELIPKADMVLGNSEELMRIYETVDFDKAVSLLQKTLSKKALAFITMGEQGAVVVMPDIAIKIPPSDVSQIPEKFELGAGDTAYAGFLAGHITGLGPEASAKLAMRIAGAKLQFDSARIPGPLCQFPIPGE